MKSLANLGDGLRRDLRYGAHSLLSQPAFTALALLALVVGLALNTSLFTAFNAIGSHPWNVPEPERVVNVYASNPKAAGGYWGFSLASARFLDDNSRTIEGAFAERSEDVRLVAAGVDAPGKVSFVTANFFDVLDVGVQPGRAFAPADDDAAAPAAVAVIGHWLWSERYGGDLRALGDTITVDGIPFTVIGVAARDFDGIDEDRTDVWLPFASLPLVQPTPRALFDDPEHCCSTLAARLRPGVSRAQAAEELNALHAGYLRDLGIEPTAIVVTGTAMLDHPQRRQGAAAPMAISLTVFGAVLLLACANVTNLLLARSAARQSEITIRMAIGAGRGRVVRQLLTEAALLAAVAAALALPLVYSLPEAALRLMGQSLPTNLSLQPDARVLVYSAGLAILCTLAFGLAPALQATRADLIGALKSRSTATARGSRLRGISLGVQVAVSAALLIVASLLVRGLDYARETDFGFRIDGVSAVAVTLPPNVYDPAAEAGLFDAVVARLDAREPVGISFLMPLGERHQFSGASCGETRLIRTQMVTAGFFEVLQIGFVEGRNFAPMETRRDAVVVNEAFARLCAPGETLTGRTEAIGNGQYEILGVVRDAQLNGTGDVDPTVFMPFAPGPVFRGEAVLLAPTPLAERAAAAVRALDVRATAEVVTMREQRERWLGNSAGLARIAGAIGLLALLLAAVGVYGVFAYYVEQRKREIGVRMALGARPLQIVALVVRQNAGALAGGLGAGLVLAAAGSLVLRSELNGLSPADPLAYFVVLLTMLVAGAAASALPAHRAARTEPNTVLHDE